MRYEITGEICDEMLPIVRAIEEDKDPIIFLDIFSLGGSCVVGIALLGVLQQARRRKQKIVTRNRGIAFSQAAALLYQGNPIYLTDASITMSHKASSFGYFPESIEDLIYTVRKFVDNIGKRDLLSFMNTEIAAFEPIDLIVDYFKDKEFKGDYYMMPSDMKAILGKQVKVRDLPQEILALDTWSMPDPLASVISDIASQIFVKPQDEDEEDDEDVVEDDEGFEYLKELEPERLIKLLDALVEEKNRRESENDGG